MGKRQGANSRRKRAERKGKALVEARKVLARSGLVLLVAGALTALVISGVLGYSELVGLVQRSSFLNIRELTVRGNAHISTKEILERSGINVQMKLYAIKHDSVRTILGKQPWINSVRLIRNLSGKVVIDITERKPVALVNLGVVYMVDMHGVLLPFTPGIATALPLFSGLRDTVDDAGRKVLTQGGMERVRAFLGGAAYADQHLASQISQVDFSDPQKLRIAFQTITAVVEVDERSIAERLHCLKQMHGMWQNEGTTVTKVNLCYQNLAFVTQRVAMKSEIVHAVTD